MPAVVFFIMKHIKTFTICLFSAMAILASCEKKPAEKPEPQPPIDQPVEVEDISIDPAEITLTEGETFQLTTIITPEDADSVTISWSSRNPETATVDDNGLVTAVAEGETTVTATAGDKTASCTVTVEAGTPSEVLFEINMADMTADEVRTAIQDALAGGNVNIKLIGEFEKTGIPTDASAVNPTYNQNPFFCTEVEVIDLTEVTGWPEVDVDGTLDYTTWQPDMDGVYGLPSLAFYGLNPTDQTPGYPALKEVRLPEEVQAIGAMGLWQCSKLETLVAPGITHIGSSALALNTSLASIELPKVDSVFTYAFANSSVQSVSLPNVHYIDYGTFDGCTQLTSLTLSAEGDITLMFFTMMGYEPFNFDTAACDLVLNADKHYENGTAEPKATSENTWATDAQNSPLTWKSITFE